MNIPTEAKIGFAIGTVPGLALAYYLFTHVTWYHNLTVEMWTNPWYIIPALAVGVTVGILSDK